MDFFLSVIVQKKCKRMQMCKSLIKLIQFSYTQAETINIQRLLLMYSACSSVAVVEVVINSAWEAGIEYFSKPGKKILCLK